jgi:hypothetical protein
MSDDPILGQDDTGPQDGETPPVDDPKTKAPEGQEPETPQDGETPPEGQEPGEDQGSDTSDDIPESPDGYDLQVPDGMRADQELLTQFKGVAHELKLSKDQAQKLVEFEAARVKAQNENLGKQLNEWNEQIKQDWGNKYEENLAAGKKALEAYDKSGEVSHLLFQTGMGSNPAVCNFLVAIGKDLGEGGAPLGRSAPEERSLEDKLYTTMKD